MKSLIIEAAKEAGKLVMKHYGKIRFVKTKERKSYFTNVDLESEKLIISLIRKKFPQHNIISEEHGNFGKKSDFTWYIDPVDGTHNYISNFPLFGVSIGLAYENEVIMGAINLPYFNEIYFAEKNKGAFLNGKKIQVSDKKELKKAFVFTDLAIRYIKDNEPMIVERLKNRVYDIRTIGCAVYGYTMVAKGNADAYISPYTNSWDMAAGALIVEEAKGRVTDFKGNKWNVNQHSYVASNKKLHNGLLKIIR